MKLWVKPGFAGGKEASSSPLADREDPAGRGRAPAGLGLEADGESWPLILGPGFPDRLAGPKKTPSSPDLLPENSGKCACCRVSRWRW